MKKRELLERIERLERRVSELETEITQCIRATDSEREYSESPLQPCPPERMFMYSGSEQHGLPLPEYSWRLSSPDDERNYGGIEGPQSEPC